METATSQDKLTIIGFIITIFLAITSFWAKYIYDRITAKKKIKERLYYEIYDSCSKMIMYGIQANQYGLIHFHFSSLFSANQSVQSMKEVSTLYDLPVALKNLEFSNSALEKFNLSATELNRNMWNILQYLDKEMSGKIVELMLRDGPYPVLKDYSKIFQDKTTSEMSIIYAHEWDKIRDYVINTSEGKHIETIQKLILSTSKYNKLLLLKK